MLLEIFTKLDSDSSGTISEGELESALSKLGVSQEKARKMMKIADVDHNEEISFEEFKILAEQVRSRWNAAGWMFGLMFDGTRR